MIPEEAGTVREQALQYYDKYDWFIIPTDPGAKKPYYGFTYKDRYGDTLPAREVVENWEEWNKPGVRVGTRTGAVSGIIALDVDSQEAHDFLKRKGHPIGPMVQSPREGGGLHLYFKHPGFYVKSTVAVAGVDGLDIRGDGGITVLPPSLDHKSGRSYEWIISPEDTAVPEAPAWLIDVLKNQSSLKTKLDVPQVFAGVPEGKRDTELNRLAGKMRQMNMPQDVAERTIMWAAEQCHPPFPVNAARAKVRWAYTHYEAGEDVAPVLDVRDRAEDDFGLFNLWQLMQENHPPVKWIIDRLIPQGTLLLAGKPKMGKSWSALGMCIAVATGGVVFGEFAAEMGKALYLALEDNKRRLQSRAAALLQSELRGDGPLTNLDLKIRSNRLDNGLIAELEEWIRANEEARLIVIDTLASVRGQSVSSRTLYEQDYEIGAALTKLAGEYNIAIIIIHHLRKGDADDPLDLVSGSTGLTGGMDGISLLTRTRSAVDGVLKVIHRDLEKDPEIALELVDKEEGWWRYAGDAEEYKLSKERKEIMDVFAQSREPMKPSEVAELLDKKTATVSKLIRDLVESGHLDKKPEYGYYGLSKLWDQDAPPKLNIDTKLNPDEERF